MCLLWQKHVQKTSFHLNLGLVKMFDLFPFFFCFTVGVLSSVVAIFYLASWQLGAVEAISLSILVGTSVDYCVHLVEGYIMAGNFIPNLHENSNKVCLNLFFKLFVCCCCLAFSRVGKWSFKNMALAKSYR